MTLLRIETVRGRLTLWYVSVLGVILLLLGGLIYVLLARALYARIDENLHAVLQIAATSLANDLAEGQDTEDAARSTAAEIASPRQLVAIYDGSARLLARRGPDDAVAFTVTAADSMSAGEPTLRTVAEADDADDRHRLAIQRVTIPPSQTTYIVVVGQSLEAIDDELASLREILAYVVPIALVVAGFGGWFLARRSLSAVVAMADRARQIGAADLTARLPVANARDELGRLAATFNDLLGRLEASMVRQRQFMADASHELRTPVATARTAAGVALQQSGRDEREYREALEIIEAQTARLSRIVDDMFTLARADAGNYPVQQNAMYLDEVLDEVVRSSRVLATARGITIETAAVPSAAYTGDEDLVRRLLGNLIDNAIRYAPAGTPVRIDLARTADRYVIEVVDHGPGIAPDAQSHIFERFYRGPDSRLGARSDGAGLGLSLARWIARVHGGDVRLTQSTPSGSRFTVELPFISRS